jgi:hypothetical protein
LLIVQLACDAANEDSNLEESREIINEMAIKFGVENEFTKKEKRFFSHHLERQEAINMIWKYEAYWTLIWALGLIEELAFPDDICDCDIAIETVSKCNSFEDFMKRIKPRDLSEILDEADLILRYDWACTDARINGRAAPANLHSGVVFERHWGLNWIIGKGVGYYEDWDCVSTDT